MRYLLPETLTHVTCPSSFIIPSMSSVFHCVVPPFRSRSPTEWSLNPRLLQRRRRILGRQPRAVVTSKLEWGLPVLKFEDELGHRASLATFTRSQPPFPRSPFGGGNGKKYERGFGTGRSRPNPLLDPGKGVHGSARSTGRPGNDTVPDLSLPDCLSRSLVLECARR